MVCRACGTLVPAHVDRCPGCMIDVGYPNVRAAENQEEQKALDRRYLRAQSLAKGRGCSDNLDRFRDAVGQSQAVICRPLSLLQTMISSETQLYATFHQLVRAEARIPADNEFDKRRLAVDTVLFPYYHEEVRFAALTLDGRGLTSYGGYSVVLHNSQIAKRATVFEENSFSFCRRHRVQATEPLPLGYRATWQKRGTLAAAKLHDRLNPDTPPEEFPRILIKIAETTAEDDFIEVHIYGPIHRGGIDRVIGPRPVNRADRTIQADLRRKLSQLHVPYETKS